MDEIAAEYSRVINQLPDESLLPIICQFALNTLFYCNVQQGTRWEGLKKLIFAHKSSLILLPNSESVDSFVEFYRDSIVANVGDIYDIDFGNGATKIESNNLDSVKQQLTGDILFLNNHKGKIDSIASLAKLFTNLKCLIVYKCSVRTGEYQTLLSTAIPSLNSLIIQFVESPRIDWKSIVPIINKGSNLKSLCIFNHNLEPLNWSKLGFPAPSFSENIALPFKKKGNEKDINDFHDDCLIMILDRVPLKDLLINCALVCPRWFSLVSTVCKRKTTLNLCEGDNYQLYFFSCQLQCSKLGKANVYHRRFFVEPFGKTVKCLISYADTLAVPQISEVICRQLTLKFPNIKHFNVHAHLKTRLVSLLTAWAPNLQTLYFEAHSADKLSVEGVDEIRRNEMLINSSMPKLRKLSINGTAGSIRLERVTPQLEELSLGNYSFGSLYNALASIDDSRLRRLNVQTKRPPELDSELTRFLMENPDLLEGETLHPEPEYIFNAMKRLFKIKPKMGSNLTHLSLICDSNGRMGISIRFLEFVCANFQSLVLLNVHINSEITLKQAFFHLSKLKHLAHLLLTSASENSFDDLPTGESDAARHRLPSLISLALFMPIDVSRFANLRLVVPNLKYVYFSGRLIICVKTHRVVQGIWEHITHDCLACNREMRAAYQAFPNMAPTD